MILSSGLALALVLALVLVLVLVLVLLLVSSTCGAFYIDVGVFPGVDMPAPEFMLTKRYRHKFAASSLFSHNTGAVQASLLILSKFACLCGKLISACL